MSYKKYSPQFNNQVSERADKNDLPRNLNNDPIEEAKN